MLSAVAWMWWGVRCGDGGVSGAGLNGALNFARHVCSRARISCVLCFCASVVCCMVYVYVDGCALAGVRCGRTLDTLRLLFSKHGICYEYFCARIVCGGRGRRTFANLSHEFGMKCLWGGSVEGDGGDYSYENTYILCADGSNNTLYCWRFNFHVSRVRATCVFSSKICDAFSLVIIGRVITVCNPIRGTVSQQHYYDVYFV